MVTAKTQYSLANAQTYFSEHLAVGDYYQEGQRVAGEWFGIGAASLGVGGKVGEAEFLALCENQHPRTIEGLTRGITPFAKRITRPRQTGASSTTSPFPHRSLFRSPRLSPVMNE